MAGQITIGTLGARGIATVDGRGVVTMVDRGIELEWMVGSETWRVVATDPSVRQSVAPGSPVVSTRIAAAGGDVVQRSFGVAASPDVVVCDFTNEGRDAVSLAVVVHAAPGARIKRIDATDSVLVVDDFEVLGANRPWQQWAVTTDEVSAREAVANHVTNGGGFEAVRMKGQRTACVALVWPLPHQTTLRLVLPLVPGPRSRLQVSAIPELASAEAVERGWDAQLDRGMRVEIDDTQLEAAIDGSRAALLLLAGADRPRPDVDDAVALEDWGLDDEAATVWNRLGVRARRQAVAARAANPVDAWVRVKTYLAAAGAGVPSHPAKFLQAVRGVVVHELPDGSVELFGSFPPEWLGLGVAVHRVPLRHGEVSFALRWHGGRPALLWDAPAGTVLRAPRLDPTWTVTAAGPGEHLLAEPPADLLAMQPSERAGTIVEDPGSFL